MANSFSIISAFMLLVASKIACGQTAIAPCNKQATKETIRLLKNLDSLKDKGFLFGHQDDLAYGVEWRYKDGRSDIKDVTGDYPAVYGWDIGGIEKGDDNNLDGVPFKKMKQYIKEGYERGGVITISWHMKSPFGAQNGSWDTTHGTVASILPGGTNHTLYKEWLDKASDFLSSLKGKKGEMIPVLFRPFHELTGTWFWWGKNACTPFEYKTLWRFTIYYLQQEKKLNNLLYVYSAADNFRSEDEFLERYPGDDMVDIFGFDAYQYDDPQKTTWYVDNVKKMLAIVEKTAADKSKLFAFTETGYETVPYKEWWTKTLLEAIGNAKISYVLLWRNHGLAAWNNKMHYYAPYKGQVSEQDFIQFYNLEKTIFEKQLADKKLYQ